MEKNDKMFVWNQDVGLLHFLKNPLLEVKLGHWVEFSPMYAFFQIKRMKISKFSKIEFFRFYEKGNIASMVRRTKQMYETKVEGELIKVIICLLFMLMLRDSN